MPYPIAHYVNCNNFSLQHQSFFAAIDSSVEPRTFSEDVTNPQWRESMNQEIDSLIKNNT